MTAGTTARFLAPLLVAPLLIALVAATAALGMPRTPEGQQALREFGGAYPDDALQRYVASIGNFLVQTTEMAGRPFTFTVLDSDIVNAFSLPGGDVFVSRGLLALANNEAELADVLGHEIGHVTAGHGEQRQTRGALAQIGIGLLGAVLGNDEVTGVAAQGAHLFLQSYSRDQEFEADSLGVLYMGRAGYDRRAAAHFLSSLERISALEGQIAGQARGDQAYDMLSDHPRTADRVERAIEAAREPVRNPMLERDIYLQKIDGLLYGDDPRKGAVRGRSFLHPELRIAFDVPPGFHLSNTDAQVVAQGRAGGTIVFDRNPEPFSGAALDYLVRAWAPNLRLAGAEPIEIGGLDAATATARTRLEQGAVVDLRFVAIRHPGGAYYRFLFVSPPQATAALDDEFRRTAYSFRRLGEAEAARVRPQHLRVVTVRPGDTIESLARRMDFDAFQRERFEVLNGLSPGAPLRPGDKVKIITD